MTTKDEKQMQLPIDPIQAYMHRQCLALERIADALEKCAGGWYAKR